MGNDGRRLIVGKVALARQWAHSGYGADERIAVGLGDMIALSWDALLLGGR